MSFPASVIELCQELVRIPSVNPSGTPGTTETGEQRCAEYLAAYLHRMAAAEVRVTEVLPGRPNVVARFPTDQDGKPRILFAPHTDTVSVAGMSIEPFSGDERDGRIWGRGASDTKGTMAAMLSGISQIGAGIATLPYEIWFAGLVGEEAGQHGALALAAEERFDFVIAGEPTGLDVVYTHKGCTNLRLTTSGTAVHAAQPDRGKNAIYEMADVIRFLRDGLAAEFRTYQDPVLGTATLSVGTVSGGSKTNIVPDRCEATVDIRTVPSQNGPQFLEHLRRRLLGVCPALQIDVGQAQSLCTDPSHPLIQKLESLGSRCVGAPWFCDAAVFGRAGMPSIALGPGSIQQAHTADEWIAIADLEAGAAFFGRFLHSLGE